jgi:polysaccharide deacetylase 2 family uncharacterized protein YibQ
MPPEAPPEPPAPSEAAPGAGGVGAAVVPLTERDGDGAVPGVRIRRPGADPAGAAPDGARPQDPGPALRRNGLAYRPPGDAPLLAVVLRDAPGLAPAEVARLDLPLTVAVDPDAPGAADRAASYRAAGLEVILAGVGLPAGATPRDAEVTLAARLARFPAVIGVMDRADDGFAGDRALAEQIAGILAQEGHGLLLWDEGLNSAREVAAGAGAATALVWRRVDGPEMSAPAVERRLDRAAFEARRAGAVVVMAEARPETLEALAAFAAEARAERVALAPASAVLLRQATGPGATPAR